MRSRDTRRPVRSRPLVALAAVFLAVAVWNAVLVVSEPAVWRGATAAGCAAASAGLWYAAVVERRR